MLSRFVALVAAFALVSVPVRAEAQAPPSATAVESLLGEMSAWMAEYYSVSQSSPLDIDGYLNVLDRLDTRALNEAQAITALTEWRDRSLAINGDARRRAGVLRRPPSMALLGQRGADLDTILQASYSGLGSLLDSQRVLIERLAEMGVGGIREPAKLQDARVRAVIESQIQLLAVAERRVRISAAALSPDHPNNAVFSAALEFYEALSAIAHNELARLDGGGDPPAVARTLRSSASEMRTELARAGTLAEGLRESARWQHTPETARLATVIVRLAETYPELLGNYGLLADALERAATKIDAGETVLDSWADLEEEVETPLANIARLDRERAGMLGQISPSL